MKHYTQKLFEINGQPSCRLLFGSLGFFIFIVLIVMTIIFGFNGKPEHIDLMKHLGYICASLLGLSALDLSNLKQDKKDDDKKSR